MTFGSIFGRLLRARPSTVARLVSVPRPASLPQTRLPFERQIFSVAAIVTLVRPEEDGATCTRSCKAGAHT
jgi:hypothetical protein